MEFFVLFVSAGVIIYNELNHFSPLPQKPNSQEFQPLDTSDRSNGTNDLSSPSKNYLVGNKTRSRLTRPFYIPSSEANSKSNTNTTTIPTSTMNPMTPSSLSISNIKSLTLDPNPDFDDDILTNSRESSTSFPVENKPITNLNSTL